MKINMNYNGMKGKSFKLNKKTLGTLAVTASFLVLFSACTKSNNKKTSNEPETTTVAVIDTVDLASLGKKPNMPSADELTAPVLGNTTGDVDKTKIVRGSDGRYYATKEDADEASKVGTVTYDTKGGKYAVTSDGTVIALDATGNEVKDSKGNTVSTGDTEIPDGYYKTSDGSLLPIGYVYADATYYGPDGSIAIKKGDVVKKETLENAKKYLSTTKPAEPQTQAPTTKPASQGTYKDPNSGLTFRSKADYDQWVLQGYEGYALVDGIMIPEEEVKAKVKGS